MGTIKTHKTVEVIGPGGRCRVPVEEAEHLVKLKSWGLAPVSKYKSQISKQVNEIDSESILRPGTLPIEGRHVGETIVILGCGPSLKDVKFSQFKNVKTIGTNQIIREYDPDYLVWLDDLMFVQCQDLIEESKAEKFVPYKIQRKHAHHIYGKYIQTEGKPYLPETFKDGLVWSYTSIFPAITLAYLMGAKNIILFGLDMQDDSHFYAEEGNKDLDEFRSLNRIIQDFKKLVIFMKEKEFTGWNANPNSTIRSLPFISKAKLKKLLNPVKKKITKLNIGAGIWECSGWATLDNPVPWYVNKGFPQNPTIKMDLTEMNSLPIKDNQLSLVYTSYLLEHLSNEEVAFTLQEVYRCLAPGGVFRIVVPDIDYEIARYTSNKISGEVFVGRFAGHSRENLTKEEIEKQLAFGFGRNKRKTLDSFIINIPKESHQKCPGNHRNWFDSAKLIRMLKVAGFTRVKQSKRHKSESKEMQNPKKFDNRFSNLALYIEANK